MMNALYRLKMKLEKTNFLKMIKLKEIVKNNKNMT